MNRLVGLMILAGFVLGLAGAAAADPADWYNSAGEGKWNYRQKLTIEHTNMVSDLTNFPVLINMATNIWKYTDNDGHVRQSNGWDFLFTASDGRTKIYHEIEKYTPTNGELVAWVNVPTLSSNVDTDIYIYYGNESCSSQWNPNAVWDANYMMVQHLGESPTNGEYGHIDSTTNANIGRPYNFSNTTNSTTNPERDVPDWDTNKKIDGADVFKGTNDYVFFGSGTSLDLPDDFTAEIWIKMTTFGGMAINHFTDANNHFLLWYNGTTFYLQSKKAGVYYRLNLGASLSTGVYYHVVGTFDGAFSRLYIDGDFKGAGNMATAYMNPTGGKMVIGVRYGQTIPNFDGVIDEVRISDMVRNDGWIKACANNQTSPGVGGFLKSMGQEEYRVKKGTIFSCQ